MVGVRALVPLPESYMDGLGRIGSQDLEGRDGARFAGSLIAPGGNPQGKLTVHGRPWSLVL